jgi:hypothetical protein
LLLLLVGFGLGLGLDTVFVVCVWVVCVCVVCVLACVWVDAAVDVDDELMVRLGDIEDALAQPHVRQSMMGERPMKGIVLVSQDADLAPWIARGVSHARSLPPK